MPVSRGSTGRGIGCLLLCRVLRMAALGLQGLFVARRSFRDQMADNAAAQTFLERMYGDLRQRKGVAPMVLSESPKKRINVNRTDANELEGAVMIEIADVLRVHPLVIFAIRANTGSAPMIGKGGKEFPLWFYRWIKSGEKMTLTDFWGAGRFGMFAIEAKKRAWHYTGKDREPRQLAFINVVRKIGGRAGFATCGQDAINILEGKC